MTSEALCAVVEALCLMTADRASLPKLKHRGKKRTLASLLFDTSKCEKIARYVEQKLL